MVTLWMSLLGPAQGAEGMWLPEQIPALADELAPLGLTIPTERLADPLGAPLGAIVSLGFCSASFVSPEGLVATNHHCVEGYLQYVSDGAQNRARDGFTAQGRGEELWAGPTARLWIVESITDVTDRVRGAVGPRTKDLERRAAIERSRKEIVAECEQTPDRRCRVASYWDGLAYRLIQQREIRDVRLVYAPPASVGSYGGEIDNWMWPRHAGDFAFVRAYVAPDGSTADHAPDNVPYAPPHHLSIDWSGVDVDELVLVAGFPGRTDRYPLADELRFDIERAMPAQVELRGEIIRLLEAHAAADADAAARLQAPMGSLGNGLKYTQGLLDGMATFDPIGARADVERQLEAWIAADPKRGKTHGRALEALRAEIAASQEAHERNMLVRALFSSSDLLSVAHSAVRLAAERGKADLDREAGLQDRDVPQIRARFERLDRTLHLASERDVVARVLARTQALPSDQRIAPLDAWIADQGGVEPALAALYDAPGLANLDARLALLEADPKALAESSDPFVQLALRLEEGLLSAKRVEDQRREGAMLRLRPRVMEGFLALQPGRVYPDANGTLRITYGRVQGVSPRDGLFHLPRTTVSGMVAKAGAPPFDAPPHLVGAAARASESRFVDAALGDVPVDFLSTVDTTGGNSGSATLNGAGELVGLLFDGTYESIASDLVFQPEMNRSIHVDVRYIGWVLDHDPAAAWLLEELGR